MTNRREAEALAMTAASIDRLTDNLLEAGDRLWDESILPSAGVVLHSDSLLGLMGPLRREFPEFVGGLEKLAAEMKAAEAGSDLRIPVHFGLSISEGRRASSFLDTDSLKRTFENLQLMAGKDMVVQTGDVRFGMSLVGTTPTLPDDFAPVIVVDASGRVRNTYSLWAEHRGNLEVLPSAGNSFHELNVHLWKRTSGKDQLADPDARNEIASAIVEKFERDPAGEWLILTYMGTKDALKASVERLCPASARPKLHWLHWGRHLSTNEFRNVDNVVIVGQFTYQSPDYLGMTLAASGLPLEVGNTPDTGSMKVGEYKHNLLQAVCRASVRNATGGIAGRCNAFIITSQPHAERVLEEVFPGCNLIRWRDDDLSSGRVAEAIAYLMRCFADPAVDAVPKVSIREELGISQQNSSANVLSHPRFTEFLAVSHLEMTRETIRRAPFGFDEIEGGYSHEPSP